MKLSLKGYYDGICNIYIITVYVEAKRINKITCIGCCVRCLPEIDQRTLKETN